MARPVKVRASYNSDAAFLLRMEEAIGLDPNQDEDWKRTACEKSRDLAQHLLTAKKVRKTEPSAATIPRRARG